MADATMNDLFGESSDDEAPAAPAAAPTPAAPKDTSMTELFGSDDEAPAPPAAPKPPTPKDTSMTDLFGASADDDDAAPAAAAAPAGDRNKHRLEDLFGDDSDDEALGKDEELEFEETHFREEPAGPPKKRALPKGTEPAVLAFPNCARPPAAAEANVVRVPKFLAFEHKPYDEDAADDEDREGQTVLRWRWKKDALTDEVLRDADGRPERESNARLVRWSDGSTQIVVGGETFDVVARALKSERLCLQVNPKEGPMCLVSHATLLNEMDGGGFSGGASTTGGGGAAGGGGGGDTATRPVVFLVG